MSHSYSDPSADDQANFLFRLYFGATGDALDQVVKRAYLDFSRTVHGAGSYPEGQREASKVLRRELDSLPSNDAVLTQIEFDRWHEATCISLCSAYSKSGYEHFFIGQAQKWVNMALKYVYVFGELRLPGYSSLYRLCHVPIDNILINTREFKALFNRKVVWSRITDYSEYMAFQVAVRQSYPASAPLAVEFVAWQQANAA